MVSASLDQWNSLAALAQEVRVKTLFQIFRLRGVEPILIKGWAAARNYPDGHKRRTGDIDIAVNPENVPRAREIIKDTELYRYLIDLHAGLRHLDTVKWDDLFAHSILVDLDGTDIRVLCPEDHLRILCVHWLIDGGRYKDKLWDIYYAVERRPDNFDWGRCLDTVSQNRRRWIICVLAIAHEYLGLAIDDLPFAGELQDVPRWVRRSIEREWNRPDDLNPVLASTHDKGLLLRQVLRRLPPNPIRATIESDGDLYGSRRWFYQMAVIGRRAGPFIKDLGKYIQVKRGRI
jgi:hypothetical protein